MSEYVGWIIGPLFFLILIFGGAFLEFLERRRQQKFAHEREMARIRQDGLARNAHAARWKDDGQTGDGE